MNNKKKAKTAKEAEPMESKAEDGNEQDHHPESGSTKFDFFTSHFCDGSGPTDERELLELAKQNQEQQQVVELRDAELACTLSNCAVKDFAETRISPEHCIPFKRLLRSFRQLRGAELSSIEQELYQFIGRYMDLCCTSQNADFQHLICLHLMAHVMRTRNLVISNKQRLQKAREQGKLNDDLIDQCRDQGLARPKVLILTPMRKFAHRLVSHMVSLMFPSDEEKRPFVQGWSRFETEFGDADGNQIHEKRQVAHDYRDLMTGNVDDCFRIGIGLAKKCLKLYTPFDESDIVLCSPLGLKMELDDEGKKKTAAPPKKSTLKIGDERKRKATEDIDGGGPHDFLASIEVLIVEQAEVLLMQNWEHLHSILALVNSVPVRVRTDITRVRPWAAHGQLARHYRQTLLFSRQNFVELHALFVQHCSNYAGRATMVHRPPDPPLVKQITVPCTLEFHRFEAASPEEQAEQRFKYFMQEMLPKCHPGTLLFISSYFDFVRVRNWLKRQTQSFVQLHEYAQPGKVAKARNLFVRGDRSLMLITERFHFFFRYRIKGIRSVMFYQLPVNPQFYPELVQMANTSENENFRLPCAAIFNRFDCLRLQNIFGPEATKSLLRPNSESIQKLEAN